MFVYYMFVMFISKLVKLKYYLKYYPFYLVNNYFISKQII